MTVWIKIWNGFYNAEISVKLCLYVNKFDELRIYYNVIVEVAIGRIFGYVFFRILVGYDKHVHVLSSYRKRFLTIKLTCACLFASSQAFGWPELCI